MNYHIVRIDKKLKTINVIFHFPIPVGQNAVGTPWKDAFLIGVDSHPTSDLYGIDATELGSIEAGDIVEHQENMRFSSTNLTNAERLAEVVARYSEVMADFYAENSAVLDFTGKQGDV